MTKITTLENGLRVISEFMPGVHSVSLGTWVGVGSRFEQPRVNGIAHFLEHMVFKGTEKRSALQIAEEIENVGGYLNACTSREYTSYYAKLMKDDWRTGVDIISDIVLNPTFDATEMERERGVILQEIGQTNDTPDDIVFDYFQEVAFPDQAMGRPILGPEENIKAMTPDDLREFITSYDTKNMVFAAAGNIDHDALVDEVSKYFGHLPKGTDQAFEKSSYQGGQVIKKRDLDQVHFVLGFESFSHYDPDYYGLSVFSNLMGGGLSSRLFQEVREKRGLVYSVYSYASNYADTGVFGVYAGTGEEHVDELFDVVRTQLKLDQFTDEELSRAKAATKSNTIMSLERTSSLCDHIAQQTLIHGKTESIESMLAKIDEIGVEDLQRIQSRILQSKPTLTLLGPVADKNFIF